VGFYDLRLPEVIVQQSELASRAGLAGFMYYRYWFTGKNLLEAPIDDRLDSQAQLPFCLMWANENWTRTWSGGEDDILLAQAYEEVPATEFIEAVMPTLLDQRYLRVDGKAVLAVYRPAQLPDVASVVVEWRRRAQEAGAGELLLLAVDVGEVMDGLAGGPARYGFDGTLGFPPHNHFWDGVEQATLGVRPDVSPRIMSYRSLARDAVRRYPETLGRNHYPGVMVAFDNTARRQHTPDVWYGSNPYSYHRWLASAADALMDRPYDERLIFINAWNEWAEGAVLEPCDRFGASFLVATRNAITA
jgi:lipopolysaccharide biosynthesis protein